MRPFFTILTRSLALVAVLFAGHLTAHAQDAEALFERLQSTYDTVESVQATFEQTMTTAYNDLAETASGTLAFQNDRYRVETGTQTFVTDGTVVWIYLADQNQVVVNDYVEEETAFSLTSFFGDYGDRYTVEAAESVQYDGALHHVLTLAPKGSDSFFSTVRLWMRDRDNLITRLEVTDLNETQMTFELTDIELNPSLPASTFTFTAPEGAELVDLRSR